MATYKRTALRQFVLANNAYKNTAVTFYTVDTNTGERTATLATLYDAPSGGSIVSNPYTLDGFGKTASPVYFTTPIIAVVNSTTLGVHETGIIYPLSGAHRGDWEASTTYLPGDTVIDGPDGNNNDNIYICTAEHTSTSSFNVDVGLYWDLVIDVELAVDSASSASASSASSSSSATAAATSATAAAGSASSAASVLDVIEGMVATGAITSSGGSMSWDASSIKIASHTATENTTLQLPSNLVAGSTYILKYTQHASSAKTLAFASGYKWPGGAAPTASTTVGAVDIYTFYTDGTNMYGAQLKGMA